MQVYQIVTLWKLVFVADWSLAQGLAEGLEVQQRVDLIDCILADSIFLFVLGQQTENATNETTHT